ncbi:MAG TPA: FUSC family protein, partial [Roseateles sp.]|nr:FUSC family protein [Roseateles sp.]
MLKPRLPAHVLNGLTVALGIGLLQLLFTGLAGAQTAQLALSGAIFASLADLPTTLSRSWGRVLAAGLAGTLAALLIAALRPWPAAVGLAIALLGFVSMLSLAWGPRAGPLSFAAVLSIVFTMAHPPASDPLAEALRLAQWHALGALAYLAWSQGVLALLQRRYRRLALAAALAATARLLRARAALLDQAPSPAEGRELPTWLLEEAQLAERLQSARDLLFVAPDTPRARGESAMLLRVIDLRDILLASRLDLELLGSDALAREVRAAVAARLALLAERLERAVMRLQGGHADPADTEPAPLLAALSVDAADPRARLLPALADRLRHLDDDLRQIHALLDGAPATLPLSDQELRLFVAPEGWPLSALRDHLSLASPVLRHALRFGLALGTAYAIALALPWASHPQWLVLSVAVVLRGNLEQTLARRNARVGGTLLGCLLVLALAQLPTDAWMSLVFLAAVGLAHGFALERYLVTAVAATVMALLQQHLVHPEAGFPVVERLADTLLGAL